MYLRSDWFIQELKHLKFRVHVKILKYIFKWGGVTCDFKSNLRCTLIRFWNHAYDFSPNCTPLSSITIIYYTHFEITVGPCNLISSNWCDLFLNRTIFCFNLHLFLSQWGGFTKNKTTNQISRFTENNRWNCRKMRDNKYHEANFATFVSKTLIFSPPKMDEFNFKLAQYCIELTKSCTWAISKWMKSRVWFQPKLHSTQFNYHY